MNHFPSDAGDVALCGKHLNDMNRDGDSWGGIKTTVTCPECYRLCGWEREGALVERDDPTPETPAERVQGEAGEVAE